jgi:hypothetical protein
MKTHLGLTIKSTITIGSKYSDLLDKPKTLGHCGFPLANPQKGLGIDFVPESNRANTLNFLCICSTLMLNHLIF